MKYLAFFAAIPHSDISYCLTTLQKYPIGNYVIGMETCETHGETNGEHLHFCVQMDDKDYTKYAKRVFIDKYQLRGKAKDGMPRQYGKVADIKDIDKMIAYTIKEKNYITNFDVTPYLDLCFSKQEAKAKEKTVKVRTKTWSEKLTDELRVKYAHKELKYDAETIEILLEEVLLALGKSSKKLSSFIVRDLVNGQFNALCPGNLEFKKDIYKQAFPQFFGEYEKYFL